MATLTPEQQTQADALAKALLEFLTKTFGANSAFSMLEPLVPIVIRIGALSGLAAAQEVMAQLAGKNSYAAWEQVIQAATAEERIVIMDVARQAAIQDCLAAIALKKEIDAALKMLLSIVVGVLAALL